MNIRNRIAGVSIGIRLAVLTAVILLAATQRSLGFFGLMLGAALLGGVVWLLVDIELLNVQSFKSATWIVLVCVSYRHYKSC